MNDSDYPSADEVWASPQTPSNPNPIQTDPPFSDGTREKLSLGGILSWLTIAVVAIGMIMLTAMSRSGEEKRTVATSSDLFPIQMQARANVGQKALIESLQSAGQEDADKGKRDEDKQSEDAGEESDEGDKEKDDDDSVAPIIPEQLNSGTYEQRLCYVLMVNENNGPDEAAKKLEKLDQDAADAEFEFSEDQTKLRDILGRQIEQQQQGNFESDHLTDEEQELVKEKLGWVGELALVPEGTSQAQTREELVSQGSRTAIVMVVFFGVVVLALLAGFVAMVSFSAMFGLGTLQPKFQVSGRNMNVYIETFAIWMLIFFVLPQAIGLAIRSL